MYLQPNSVYCQFQSCFLWQQLFSVSLQASSRKLKSSKSFYLQQFQQWQVADSLNFSSLQWNGASRKVPSACSCRLSEKYAWVNKIWGWYLMTLDSIAWDAGTHIALCCWRNSWDKLCKLEWPYFIFIHMNEIAGCFSQFFSYLKWIFLNRKFLTYFQKQNACWRHWG